MFKRSELESLPGEDVAAADKLRGIFLREHARGKGRQSEYHRYLEAFGMLQAFAEARTIDVVFSELGPNRLDNINLIVDAFDKLIRDIKQSHSRRDVRGIKSKYIDSFRVHADSPTCFIIMPFGKGDDRQDNDLRFQLLFRPAAESVGYKCLRADRDPHAGGVPERLVSHLISSEAVVADLTGLNPNVLYELGVRHATARKTVIVAPRGSQVPFDVDSINRVTYSEDYWNHPATVDELAACLRAESGLPYLKAFSPRWEQDYLDSQERQLAVGKLDAFSIVEESHTEKTRMFREGAGRQAFLTAVHARLVGAPSARRLLTVAAEQAQGIRRYQCTLEEAILDFSYGRWDEAQKHMETLIGSGFPEIESSARILWATCMVAQRKPIEAQALLGAQLEHSLGGKYYVYLALQHCLCLLAQRDIAGAQACLRIIRRWGQERTADYSYPFVEDGLIASRALLDLISDPYYDCTRTEALMNHPRHAPGRGSAATVARVATLLRGNGRILDAIQELARIEGWVFNRNITVGRLKWFERKVFQWHNRERSP